MFRQTYVSHENHGALSRFLCLASSLTSNIVPQALPRQDKEQGGPLHVRCRPLPAQDRDLPVPGTALPPKVGVYSGRVNFYLSKIAYPGHSGPPSFLSMGLPRGVYLFINRHQVIGTYPRRIAAMASPYKSEVDTYL